MKRNFAIIFVAAMLVALLALTACGRNGEDEVTPDPVPTPTPAQAVEEPPTDDPDPDPIDDGGPRWRYITSYNDIIFDPSIPMVRLCNDGREGLLRRHTGPLEARGLQMEFPPIAVNVERHQQLAAKVAANEHIDAFTVQPGQGDWPYLILAGLVQPVDDLLCYESSPVLSHLVPMIDTLRVNGRSYVLPTGISPSICIIFYNRTLFDDLGLTTPTQLVAEDRWTMDIFEEYVNLLTMGDDGYGHPEQLGAFIWDYVPFISATGRDLISMGPDGLFVSNLRDPAISAALERIQRMHQTQSVTQDLNRAIDMFNRGRMGFWVGAGWMTFWFDDMIDTGNVYFVPTPRDTNVDNWYIDANLDAVMIPLSARNVDALVAVAITEAMFASSHEGAMDWATSFAERIGRGDETRDLFYEMLLNPDDRFTPYVSVFKNFHETAAREFTDAYWADLLAGVSWSTIAESLAPIFDMEVANLNEGRAVVIEPLAPPAERPAPDPDAEVVTEDLEFLDFIDWLGLEFRIPGTAAIEMTDAEYLLIEFATPPDGDVTVLVGDDGYNIFGGVTMNIVGNFGVLPLEYLPDEGFELIVGNGGFLLGVQGVGEDTDNIVRVFISNIDITRLP